MTLQDICTTLETSRKLKEAGFPQERGVAYWIDNEIEVTSCKPSEIEYDCTHWSGGENCRRDCSKCELSRKIKHKVYRAFTFNELLNYFRNLKSRELMSTRCFLEIDNYTHPSLIRATLYDAWTNKLYAISRNNPQEAAAELALWCVKEGYLNLEEGKDG
jgi:hypothetical protein